MVFLVTFAFVHDDYKYYLQFTFRVTVAVRPCNDNLLLQIRITLRVLHYFNVHTTCPSLPYFACLILPTILRNFSFTSRKAQPPLTQQCLS